MRTLAFEYKTNSLYARAEYERRELVSKIKTLFFNHDVCDCVDEQESHGHMLARPICRSFSDESVEDDDGTAELQELMATMKFEQGEVSEEEAILRLNQDSIVLVDEAEDVELVNFDDEIKFDEY